MYVARLRWVETPELDEAVARELEEERPYEEDGNAMMALEDNMPVQQMEEDPSLFFDAEVPGPSTTMDSTVRS